MRPEVASTQSDSTQSDSTQYSVDSQKKEDQAEQSPGMEDVDLTDEEKLILDLLKDNSPIDLNELKGQTGLSNKKWDKAIKGLTKNNLAKMEKTEEGLLVSVV